MNELTSWGYHWSESGVVSWNQYLRRQDIVRAINGGAATAAAGLSRCMATNTREVIGSVQSLERTFESSVSRAADQISATFTWGFGEMLASLGGIQTSLDELLKVAKTPAQTAAYEQFEIARDAYRKGLYPECLEALSLAIKGSEGGSAGYQLEWRFYHLRGLVLLGSHDHADSASVNPVDAEQSFLAAARYAKADQPKDAAKAFLSAGWAAYVQVDRADSGKLRDALEHTQRAREIDPNLGEALFQAAKVQMALGRPGPALEALKEASALETIYLAKAAADGDFHRYQAQLDRFVNELQAEKVEEMRRELGLTAVQIEAWCDVTQDLQKHPSAQRVVSFGKHPETKSLLELLDYGPGQRRRDDVELKSCVFMACRKEIKEWEETLIEKVPTGEVDRVEVIEHETYWDEEVRPGGWFRKEARAKVQKTRPKLLVKEVARMREVQRTIRRRGTEKIEWFLVDGLGRQSLKLLKAYDGFGKAYDGFGIPVVFILPGSFIMGSPGGKFERREDEIQHTVTLSRPFALAQTQCTQWQWEAMMGNNPSNFKGDLNRPVETVSWDEAVEYCRKLTTKQRAEGILTEGWEWRLPTEAEWEYAARAGTAGVRHGELDTIAWYTGNSSSQTHPVKQKAANAWGLHDMMGNVWEWCSDWHGDYPTSRVTDPRGSSSGSNRVTRGGGWNNDPGSVRSAYRYGFGPGIRRAFLGFRPALSLVR